MYHTCTKVPGLSGCLGGTATEIWIDTLLLLERLMPGSLDGPAKPKECITGQVSLREELRTTRV